MKKEITSLSAGEITPALQGRTDLEKYHFGLHTCLNTIISILGEGDSRPGFEFIGEVEDSNYPHRLESFSYSRDDSYALVFGQLKLELVKNGAMVENPPATRVTITSPYTAVQNPGISKAQSADVIFIANSIAVLPPYTLSRQSAFSWTFDETEFVDGPWIPFEEYDDKITMTPSAKTGSGVTITCSETFPYPNSNGVDGIVRLGYENPFDPADIEWSWATITAAPTGTTRTVTIEKDLGFEYLLNPEFAEDIAFWRDESTAGSPSYASHDAATQTLVLNKGASGEALVRQELVVPTYERMTFEITVDVVNTSLKVFIGTGIGLSDVLASQTITTPGDYSYDTVVNEPNVGTIYVTIWTSGAPVASTHKISRTSLMRKGIATKHWRVGVWSDDNTRPTKVAMLGDRLWFGGGNLRLPDTFWASRLGGYLDHGFHSPILDTDAFSYPLGSSELNAIQSLVAKGEMTIMTTGAEWRVDAGGNVAITPTAINAKAKSYTGSSAVQPLVAGSSLLFLNAASNTVYNLPFSIDADEYEPDNLSVLAEHLLADNSIVQWAYQRAPHHIIWAVRDDGILLGFTYLPKEKVWAWHRHQTDGLFESVTVVPEGSSGDVVYVIVNRTIRGVTKRYIEKMMPRITDAEIYDYYAVDSGVTINDPKLITSMTQADPAVITSAAHGYSDGDSIKFTKMTGQRGESLDGQAWEVSDKTANTYQIKDSDGNYYGLPATPPPGMTDSTGQTRKMITSVTGISHLEGETVIVLADGAVIKDKIVASGAITLDDPASLIHVGLPYNSDLLTLPLEGADQRGPTKGREKHLTEASVYFKNTAGAGGLKIGPDFDNLQKIDFTSNSAASGDNPAPLFTGAKKKKTLTITNDQIARLAIRQEDPIPMTVSSIITWLEVEEPESNG